MRALITSVGYADFLSVTLPRNRHHFDEVLVVTGPQDHETRYVAESCGARVLATYAFHRLLVQPNGIQRPAVFNKYAAIEEGLDVLGRTGWICLLDADVVLPTIPDLFRDFMKGNLYGPRRRMLVDMAGLPILLQESEWGELPLHRLHFHPQWHDHFSGYCQIFHADDPHLGAPPWHRIDLSDAGKGDTYFQDKWPKECRVRPSWEVLHLGDDKRRNWRGRVTPRIASTPLPSGG